jgi:Flp pilus assembly pilin Flp
VKALRGQTGVEYGLLIALIAVLTLLGANAFGSAVRQWFDVLVSRITTNS